MGAWLSARSVWGRLRNEQIVIEGHGVREVRLAGWAGNEPRGTVCQSVVAARIRSRVGRLSVALRQVRTGFYWKE